MASSFTFSVPAANTSISHGPKSSSIGTRNLARVQANPHLAFMLEPTQSGGHSVYNKRSSLPGAKKIIGFNRARPAGWGAGKKTDMRTTSEQAWATAKKPSLSSLKQSRNHKIPDSLLGSMINRSVISSELDDSATAKKSKNSLMNFAGHFLRPLDVADRKKAMSRFKDNIDVLTSGGLNKATYRQHFNAAKRELSASVVNLRLGISTVNSGIGDSLDLNIMRRKKTPARPPSPISHHLEDGFGAYAQAEGLGPVTGFRPIAGGHFATSSETMEQ